MDLSQLGLLLIVMGMVVSTSIPQTDPDFGQGMVPTITPQTDPDFGQGMVPAITPQTDPDFGQGMVPAITPQTDPDFGQGMVPAITPQTDLDFGQGMVSTGMPQTDQHSGQGMVPAITPQTDPDFGQGMVPAITVQTDPDFGQGMVPAITPQTDLDFGPWMVPAITPQTDLDFGPVPPGPPQTDQNLGQGGFPPDMPQTDQNFGQGMVPAITPQTDPDFGQGMMPPGPSQTDPDFGQGMVYPGMPQSNLNSGQGMVYPGMPQSNLNSGQGMVYPGMPQSNLNSGQGMVSDKISEIDAKFRQCKAELDKKASDKCDFAGNIHICADMVGGELASRSKAELNSLGCDSKIETCGNTVFGKCVLWPACSGIGELAMCFLRHDCAKYDVLLNKYIKKCNYTCDAATNMMFEKEVCGKPPTLSGTDRNTCPLLDRYIVCMNAVPCPVSSDLKKNYTDLQCGNTCSGCPFEITKSRSKVDKCRSWAFYFSCVKGNECEFLEKDIRDYTLLNCDDLCKYICGTGDFDMKKDRKEGCETISRYSSCLKSVKCPISQVIKDYISHYGCDKSCNVDKLDSCRKNTVPIVNSTRDEACSFYRRYMDCSNTAKCENDTNVELYFKNLQCGAGNLSLLVAIMISMVVSFQMLDTYFGN